LDQDGVDELLSLEYPAPLQSYRFRYLESEIEYRRLLGCDNGRVVEVYDRARAKWRKAYDAMRFLIGCSRDLLIREPDTQPVGENATALWTRLITLQFTAGLHWPIPDAGVMLRGLYEMERLALLQPNRTLPDLFESAFPYGGYNACVVQRVRHLFVTRVKDSELEQRYVKEGGLWADLARQLGYDACGRRHKRDVILYLRSPFC
jgi:hypothetical protein